MNKLKKMNIKRGFICFITCAVIFALASGIVSYMNFGGRTSDDGTKYETTDETFAEQYQEYLESADENTLQGKGSKLFGHGGSHNILGRSSSSRFAWGVSSGRYNAAELSTQDQIIMGIISIGRVLLVIWYWVLCMIWSYQKAVKLKRNPRLWVALTFFFNLLAMLILYIFEGSKKPEKLNSSEVSA